MRHEGEAPVGQPSGEPSSSGEPGAPAELQGNLLRHVLLALQFFTRIPLPARVARWVGYSPALMKASTAHFPAVGWLVGGVAALVLGLVVWGLAGMSAVPAHDAVWLLVALVAALLSTMATVLLTGAFHEDGLADVGDALGGSADRETALRIMKDSRLGTYGTITLLLVLLLKLCLLALLQVQGLAHAMLLVLAMHVLSRWTALLLPQWLPYVGGTPVAAGGTSKARSLLERLDRRILWVSSLWALPAVLLVARVAGGMVLLGVMVTLLLVVGGLGRFFRRRLGGITGDCMGATQQLAEVSGYLVLCLSMGAQP